MSDKSGNKKYNITQKYNSESFLEEIEAKVDKNSFDKFFEKALDDLMKVATAPGFRKGKVPRNVVLANRYSEIADRAVELAARDIIKSIGELKPKPLDAITIKSVKSASEDANSDLVITLAYLPFPEVVLGDYSKIEYKNPEVKTATNEEVEKEVINVWFSYAQKLDQNTKKEDFKKENITEDFCKKAGIYNDESKISNYEDLYKFVEDYINRSYVQSSSFESENLIIKEALEKTKFVNSEGLVSKELDRRLQNYLGKFKEIGVDPEEYLKKNNVNLDDLKNEWKSQAEHDVKLELLLQEYGKQNHIHPSEEELKDELSKLDTETKKMYNFDEERLRSLISYYYVNNKAYLDLVNKIKNK